VSETQLEINIGRCSACTKKFHLIPSKKTAVCPHCKEAYFFHKGKWQNEKLRDILKPKPKSKKT